MNLHCFVEEASKSFLQTIKQTTFVVIDINMSIVYINTVTNFMKRAHVCEA